MEANQILQSNILDIIFDGRNKSYGAYYLRKTYEKRITVALAGTLILILILIISSVIAHQMRKERVEISVFTHETRVLSDPKNEPRPLPLPKPKPPVHVASVKYSVPVITVDKNVIDPPPDVKQIEKAIIDNKTIEGNIDIDKIDLPSNITGTNVLSNPLKKNTTDDAPFRKVEIEATFPGGLQAWQRYIQRAIMAQLDEFSESDYGTCNVQFIVDKNGKVSDVNATTMKGTRLEEIAVNAIRKGPDWIPAVQNGRNVNAYRTQPVTLTNPDQ